jgi:hypothetical protein
MPSSRHVRMMRTAISPRLAIRTFVFGRATYLLRLPMIGPHLRGSIEPC